MQTSLRRGHAPLFPLVVSVLVFDVGGVQRRARRERVVERRKR